MKKYIFQADPRASESCSLDVSANRQHTGCTTRDIGLTCMCNQRTYRYEEENHAGQREATRISQVSYNKSIISVPPIYHGTVTLILTYITPEMAGGKC